MGNIRTRNFKNFHQPPIEEADYEGPRVYLDNQYKLVLGGSSKTSVELFDLSKDSAEEENLADQLPQVTSRLSQELRTWQTSVLKSLQEKDYQED